MAFERHLEDNLFALRDELHAGKYKHSPYRHFPVFDNKKRDIHKAETRDKIVHQTLSDYLEKLFEPSFIADSYASRKGKGIHRAIKALRYFIRLAGEDCFVLKCDIRKYFDSIDHNVLLSRLSAKIKDKKAFLVAEEIVGSFESEKGSRKGIPLGNVTSQVFANIYLDSLDKFIKQKLGARYYVRYNDDIAIADNDRVRLNTIRIAIQTFAKNSLLLEIPDSKTSIRKVSRGIEFLGSVITPEAVMLRGTTKAKIFSKMTEKNIHSKLGMLKQGDFFFLRQKLLSDWRRKNDMIE